MSGAGGAHLVVERGGQLWGVPGGAVEHLSREGGRLTVRLATGAPGTAGGAGGTLWADRLLSLTAGLAVRPAPAALGRYWNEHAGGLALFAGRPVVVIDPARPPRVLLGSAEDRDG